MTLVYFLVFMSAVTVIVIAIWPRTGEWGINLSKVHCPKCGDPMPRIRKPKNERQRLWGGWTCSKCGCEMDKYGVEVVD
jgi:hypothetical protein